MNTWLKRALLLVLLLVVFGAGWLTAKTGMCSRFDPRTLPEIERQFVEKMNGAALVGRFTVTGPAIAVVSPALRACSAMVGASSHFPPLIASPSRMAQELRLALACRASGGFVCR